MLSDPVTINNLVINDANAASLIRFNGWISIDNVEGLDEAEFDYEVQNLAFQDGSIMSEGYYNGRLITISVSIYAVSRATRNNLLNQLKTALNPKMDAGEVIELIYREEGESVDRIVYCRPTGRIKADRKKGEYGRKQVQFSLFAEDPRLYTNVLKTRKLTLNKNLLLWTEDISQSAWVVEGTATKTDADTVSSIAVNGGIRQTVNTGNHANKTYTFQIELNGTAGQTIDIYIADGVGGAIGTPTRVTLTSSFAEYFVTRTFSNAETSINTVVYVVRRTGATATSVNIRKAQLIEHDAVDVYRKNEGTYGGVNGVNLPTYLPLFLISGIGDKFNIVNSGNMSTIPEIKIYGPIVKPGLVNEATGEYIQFNYSLGVGETLTIDMRNRRIYREDGSNVYGFITQESKFWKLASGINPIGLIAETYSATGYAEVAWRDANI